MKPKIIITFYFFALAVFSISCKNTVATQIKSGTPVTAYGCIDGDCKNGIGTFLWENGSKYIGQFKNGNMNGHGTFYFGEGSVSPDSKYTGEFKSGFIHGYGTWTWSNGDKYIGDCKYNKMDGSGTYYYSDGTSKKGKWLNDKYIDG